MENPLHSNEIAINTDLVRQLVHSQFPRYSSLPLSRLTASGSSNVLFRLGDSLLVRLPRQPGGSASIDKEQRWLPEIGRHLPVTVPEIVHIGQAADAYPERWSIVSWLAGELPQACTPEDGFAPERSRLASDLADVILALRAVAVPEVAATDPHLRSYRGRPLSEFTKQFQRNVQLCRSIKELDLDLDAALTLWEAALTLPGASSVTSDHWYHSDLVAENLLLADGCLSSVLDFGGLAVGDPTIDLHGAWELFDPPAREVFRTRMQVDEPEWLRGRAWALAIALGAFSYYWNTMPGRCADRLAMARSTLADQSAGLR